MDNNELSGSNNTSSSRPETLVSILGVSWFVGGILLLFLMLAGGLWNLAANTRVLDLMIEGGIVRFHDMQIGPIAGVPELKYFVASQDPIAWPLLGLALLLMCVFWTLKGIQVRYLLERAGVNTEKLDTFRLYLSAQSRDRWLPMRGADLMVASELAARGESEAVQRASIENIRSVVVMELMFFSLVSLIFLGWTAWLEQALLGIFILGLAYWITRSACGWTPAIDYLGAIKASFARLSAAPLYLLGIFALSAVAFFAEHVAVYALSQAFTSTHVIINIEFPVFLMALVAGNVARLIPLTPGGLGQFEWGFATAIYLSGTGMPEAVTMAILFALLRYTGGAIFGVLFSVSKTTITSFSTCAAALVKDGA